MYLFQELIVLTKNNLKKHMIDCFQIKKKKKKTLIASNVKLNYN